MARSRLKIKGRLERGSFMALPHEIVRSPEWASLSGGAIKALLDLFAQYRGHNNGDFTAAWVVMQPRGWKSKETLYRALRELEVAGWIICSRRGHRHLATLYGVSWLPINDCGRKLDIAPSPTAYGTWRARSGGTESVPHWPENRANSGGQT